MLVRRLWLAPTVLIVVSLYYLYVSRLQEHAYQTSTDRKATHLVPQPPVHPVSAYIPLPTGRAKDIPAIQHDFSKSPETPNAKKIRLERQAAVKESFLHAWEGYKKYAWAKDEVAPISGRWRDSFGGWGATLVDTMDTLWMMGLKHDFELCVKAVTAIDFTTNSEDNLNVFETTIRYLGGLLAAYDISGQRYPILLKKAQELGEILYMAFDTPNHMPVTRWEWKKTGTGQGIQAGGNTLIAEMASLTLEFTRLAQLTHESKYFDAVHRIAEHMAAAQNTTRMPGLWPVLVDAHHIEFKHNFFTLGGMADSAYEYLPKQYLLLGGLDAQYQTMYTSAIETAQKYLFYRPLTAKGEKILFSGNSRVSEGLPPIIESQAQHLACFVGGMVGVGSKIFDRPEELPTARQLVDGCIWAYDQLPTGLMPEISYLVPCQVGVPDHSSPQADDEACAWSDETYYSKIASKFPSKPETDSMTPTERGKYYFRDRSLVIPFTDLPDNRYILRPEAIESVFILYRITGDSALLDSAWRMFQNIEKATRTEIAHAGIYDVRQSPPTKSDRMESFWLAETLKYFWLIFSEPQDVSLDDWVLNTEAHPFRRPKVGEMMG